MSGETLTDADLLRIEKEADWSERVGEKEGGSPDDMRRLVAEVRRLRAKPEHGLDCERWMTTCTCGAGSA